MTIMAQDNQLQQQQQKIQETTITHLPTALGLKVRTNLTQQTQISTLPQQQSTTSVSMLDNAMQTNANSLLKQQLRAALKEIEPTGMKAPTTQHIMLETISLGSNSNSSQGSGCGLLGNDVISCSALQSLANAAERQAQNALQPPSANNLHHQFLLHMAANPMLQNASGIAAGNANLTVVGSDYFQQKQQQQQQELEQQQQTCETELGGGSFEMLLESNDKSEPELTLADESAGLEYKTTEECTITDKNEGTSEQSLKQQSVGGHKNNGKYNNAQNMANSNDNQHSGNGSVNTSGTRSVQRRRVRRKAQSTVDDQAEHLTEMSVRGLDLFRYASINEGVYQCTECAKENVQKTFKNKYSFQRHAFLYHEGKHRKVFPCPVCSKEFSRPDKMKNHLKMVHENFVSVKDVHNFNPLNYLISAAAAGDIHAPLFTPTDNTTTGTVLASQITTLQNVNVLNAAEIADGAGGTNLENVTMPGEERVSHFGTEQPVSPQGEVLQKFDSDIIIKNEIIISPTPSPPPLTPTPTRSHRRCLEEVK